MENKRAFLDKVAGLFIEHGAKTLTMDDIAREFGISKKTLYQYYSTKEALLEEVLKYKLKEVVVRLKNLETRTENAVERMYCRDAMIEQAIESNNSILLRQLVKYYPAIFNRHMVDFSEKFSQVLAHNTQRGRKQGLYRKDFDELNYARMFFQLAMSYDSSPHLDTEKVDRRQYQQAVMDMYLNSITTEEGKKIMNQFKNQ